MFGSRVKGDSWETSDIDVGIEGPKALPSRVRFALEEEIEHLPTLYTIDLVDFKEVSPKFKKEALKWTEYLN